MVFTVSEAWKAAHPGASVGVLAIRGVINPSHHPSLDEHREELEQQLRSRYSGYDRAALKALPVISAYNAYYKRFKKTYHVQLQLESVIMAGKSVPRVATMVEAMFMAELKNHLLTAGHDLEALELPVGIDVVQGIEQYVRINGEEQQLKSGDMMISDATGVISSVLYGPDRRTRITPETKQVLFTVYVPPGIEEQLVNEHLQDILANVLMVVPTAEVEALEVYGTA